MKSRTRRNARTYLSAARATFFAVRTVRVAVLLAVDTAPVAVRAADDAVRAAERTAPLTSFWTPDAGGARFGRRPVALISSLTASDSASTRSANRSTALFGFTPSLPSA